MVAPLVLTLKKGKEVLFGSGSLLRLFLLVLLKDQISKFTRQCLQVNQSFLQQKALPGDSVFCNRVW
jgi:hypothetical protein